MRSPDLADAFLLTFGSVDKRKTERYLRRGQGPSQPRRKTRSVDSTDRLSRRSTERSTAQPVGALSIHATHRWRR